MLRATSEQAARVAVETRLTRGAPYSADAVTEFVQVLADGNRIVRRTTNRLVRDSEGRTRRETIGQNGVVENVVITDPVAGNSVTLNPTARTARRSPSMVAWTTAGGGGRGGAVAAGARGGAVVAVEPAPAPGARGRGEATIEQRQEIEARARAAREELTAVNERVAIAVGGFASRPNTNTNREELGQQTIEGVTATGTRETTTIAAGTIGNENPITIVSEQWYSSELQMLIMTRHSDPRSGETTYRVTNITRTEPDAALFQVPSDYTVQEAAPAERAIVRPRTPGNPQ